MTRWRRRLARTPRPTSQAPSPYPRSRLPRWASSSSTRAITSPDPCSPTSPRPSTWCNSLAKLRRHWRLWWLHCAERVEPTATRRARSTGKGLGATSTHPPAPAPPSAPTAQRQPLGSFPLVRPPAPLPCACSRKPSSHPPRQAWGLCPPTWGRPSAGWGSACAL